MGGEGDSGGEKPRIDAGAKAAFLKAMREGARLDEAATAHGVTLQAFRAARKRDPEFDVGWREAHSASAEAERGGASTAFGGPSTMLGPTAAAQPLRGRHLPPEDASHARPLPSKLGEERIVPNNRRRLQRRKMRNVRFDEERQQRFLAQFAWSCDTVAAAAAAGVREQTVQNHRRKNPAFAAEFEEALEQGYVTLEAEALRQRLAAQKKLRAAIEGAGRSDAALMPDDVGAEFERVMKLLARWDRKRQRPSRLSPEGGRRACTFDAAIALLDARLKALGIAVEPVSPADAERYDATGESRGGEGETP